jgi:hypothetical protein
MSDGRVDCGTTGTTVDFGTFIGIETPAELANLFAGHALIGTGMRGGMMQHLKKGRQGVTLPSVSLNIRR